MPGGQTAGWLHARPFCDIAAGIFNKQAKSANIVVPQQESQDSLRVRSSYLFVISCVIAPGASVWKHIELLYN